MGTVEHDPVRGPSLTLRISQVRIGGMCGNEGLRLRGNGGKHALLVETNAVAATAIMRTLEPRATDLPRNRNQNMSAEPRDCHAREHQ